jgi:hypothetical protein
MKIDLVKTQHTCFSTEHRIITTGDMDVIKPYKQYISLSLAVRVVIVVIIIAFVFRDVLSSFSEPGLVRPPLTGDLVQQDQ